MPANMQANLNKHDPSSNRPPTYLNRKVGDRFIYRGVEHRVVAIHQIKDNRLAGASSKWATGMGGDLFRRGGPRHHLIWRF